ncbi:hypothetical protein Ddye_018623 [Dipteronia dyeriana]|uniref:Uncharacterized protein n=1 Tax=Dipteronia dyeriana TaxID=168575 RepID=A0AAD9X0Z8_9ROSI|nr:hypothetical protein Ddye_018623 [Dipteronia dyeriana]
MDTKSVQGPSIPEIGEDNNYYSRNNAIQKLNQGPYREPVNVDKCVKKKVHRFYFVKFWAYEDQNLKSRIAEAEKLIKKIGQEKRSISIKLQEIWSSQYYVLLSQLGRLCDRKYIIRAKETLNRKAETLDDLQEAINSCSHRQLLLDRKYSIRGTLNWKTEKMDDLQEFINLCSNRRLINRVKIYIDVRLTLLQTFDIFCTETDSDLSLIQIRHRPNNLATENKLLKEINDSQQKGAIDHPCSSVENFSKLIGSMSSEIKSLDRNKDRNMILKKIKWLEKLGKEAIANATEKGNIGNPLFSIKTIYDQVKLINKKLLEEFRKEQLEVRSKISCVEKDLDISRKDLESLRIQLVDLQLKQEEVELHIKKMRKQQNETKARYASVLSNARDLARKKDVKSLEELSLREEGERIGGMDELRGRESTRDVEYNIYPYVVWTNLGYREIMEAKFVQGSSIREDKNDTGDTSYCRANAAAQELNQGKEFGEPVKIDERSYEARVCTPLKRLRNRESGIKMVLDMKTRILDDLQEALQKLSFAKNFNPKTANKVPMEFESRLGGFFGKIECQNDKRLKNKIKRLEKVGKGDTADATKKGKIGNPLNSRKAIQDLVRKARYDKYVSVLSNAKELARKKDVKALQELSLREVDIVMCRWNRSKDFRCRYVIMRKAS